MALRKKFTRTTKGRNQQVIAATPIAISADATLAAFIASAPTGKIGVFDALDALHTNAITATEKFYIVQKKSDGSIKRTTLLKWSDVVARRKTYVAPVKAVGSLGWSGTVGAMNLAAAPASGKLYELAIIETTEGNQPFPTWNYEYAAKPGDTEIDVVGALAKRVNNSDDVVYKSNDPLVVAKVKAVATYGNYTTTGTYTVTKGSTLVALTVAATDPAVGDYISFDATGTPSAIIGDVYKVVSVVAGVSFTLNRAYTGATQIFIAAEASGTRVKKVTVITATGLVFTAINDEEHFKVVARQELVNATIVNLSSFTKGNGTTEQVRELELEGNALDGNTAGNTVYGNEGYGNPDKFAVTNGETETYDLFHLDGLQQATLVGNVDQGKRPISITIAAPKSAGGLSASLNTLFGL